MKSYINKKGQECYRFGKVGIRKNSPLMYIGMTLAIIAFVVVMNIPGSIDAASGIVPR